MALTYISLGANQGLVSLSGVNLSYIQLPLGETGGGTPAEPLPLYPEPISNLAFTQLDLDRGNLTWSLANVPANATAIHVYGNGVLEANVAANATSANVANLAVGTTTNFDVVVVTADGVTGLGGGISVSPRYMPGYPFSNTRTAEPNVVAQWVLNQASGDAVDVVSNITLPPSATAPKEFSVAALEANFLGFVGVACEATLAGSGGGGFIKGSAAPASANVGTGNFMLEFVTHHITADGTAVLIEWGQTVSSSGGLFLYTDFRPASGRWRLNGSLCATDLTAISWTHNFTDVDISRRINKWRILFDRSGNITTYLNGTSIGTSSMAALVGKTIAFPDMALGVRFNNTEAFGGILYECRLSLNLTNNSGGPGGG